VQRGRLRVGVVGESRERLARKVGVWACLDREQPPVCVTRPLTLLEFLFIFLLLPHFSYSNSYSNTNLEWWRLFCSRSARLTLNSR
jgi:hypothetical protein